MFLGIMFHGIYLRVGKKYVRIKSKKIKLHYEDKGAHCIFVINILTWPDIQKIRKTLILL
ncbi:MAG: septum formation topological specificity factor MinE [Marivirga sp.]